MISDPDPDFDLGEFLPYLLNQAAQETSAGFHAIYRAEYGMLRTEWRVMVHLGRHGEMSASEIGRLSMTHKAKISRAVRALEEKRFLQRCPDSDDRRSEILSLTPEGHAALARLSARARAYGADIEARFTDEERALLKSFLRRLATETA
ncbi:MarR family winged helix-turn-helix transcriptional regulator [Rhodovulum sp. MB263]|uniref:MarR family winged helix-turn-helix transcriptional regulator n=1 Tax=Rhodovulum sp. (strain MB263) TaxID=308754 RepID=UPI0009B79BE6|nr:MarR family transcriptional regulator [Rhodovulum sp. MB263]ARC87904.1 MarR family transcriptional regulator [Rhodovulum sp. MB263]